MGNWFSATVWDTFMGHYELGSDYVNGSYIWENGTWQQWGTYLHVIVHKGG